MDDTIRIAGVIKQSIVDGPGLRFVVFTQGCPHACPGCHNPDTHDFAGGYDCRVADILAAFDENPLLRGVTLSGGEPFCRAVELIPLVREIRRRGKNVWCFTGYTLEQLLAMAGLDPAIGELLRLIDVLIDGPFLLEERDLTLQFRGSENQRVLNLPASLAAGQAVPITRIMG
jgi:anaerobic ribonucleoside-triphosphate reductase activating protein